MPYCAHLFRFPSDGPILPKFGQFLAVISYRKGSFFEANGLPTFSKIVGKIPDNMSFSDGAPFGR